MLALKVYDRGNEIMLTFEHSLLSLSKWEAKFKKAFLGSARKSSEEMIDYYQAMLTSPEHGEDMVFRLSPAQMDQLTAYISDPMTASVAPKDDDQPRHSGEILTSDIIYYQMVALKIPFEAQTWHLNRLMMLIAITSHRQKPPKKESKGNLLARWQEINQRNRERFNSQG